MNFQQFRRLEAYLEGLEPEDIEEADGAIAPPLPVLVVAVGVGITRVVGRGFPDY